MVETMIDFPNLPGAAMPSPNFPGNLLSNNTGQIMPATIISFCGNIDYQNKTYELITSNKFISMDFSPTIKNSTGWIVCVGSDVKISLFPSLFQTIGFLYGTGKNADEFKLPDYMGYFFRGLALDDAVDKGFAERVKNPATGSSGTSNGVGSIQQNMVQKHEHKYVNLTGKIPPFILGAGNSPTNSENKDVFTDSNIYSSQKLLSGNETRPVNIYINYLIYAGLPSAATK
jgi:hypothetical protein